MTGFVKVKLKYVVITIFVFGGIVGLSISANVAKARFYLGMSIIE